MPLRRAATGAALLLFVVLVLLNFLYDAEDQIDAGARGILFSATALAVAATWRRMEARSNQQPHARRLCFRLSAVLEEEGVVFDRQMELIEDEVLSSLVAQDGALFGADALAMQEAIEDALTFDGYGGEDDTDARRRLGRRALLGAGGAVFRWWRLR